jgi:hypothetical protein
MAHKMRPIVPLAAKQLNIDGEMLEPYGKFKAKVPFSVLDGLPAEKGKLILMTALTPTKVRAQRAHSQRSRFISTPQLMKSSPMISSLRRARGRRAQRSACRTASATSARTPWLHCASQASGRFSE